MDGMLSQEEINALLNASTEELGTSEPATDSSGSDADDLTLTEIQCDAVGEVANICMGTSATTLNSLLNRKVNITIPSVTVTDWDSLTVEYEKPCVFVQIKYTVGLDGSNMLVLKEDDVKIIADLMMGGDGTNIDGELTEIHLSAISEAMNQMMGSSATSLSSMLGKIIDISPPSASLIPDMVEADPGDLNGFLHGKFVRIAFRMQIENLIDSTLMQLYPIDFAKDLVDVFMNNAAKQAEEAAHEEPPVMQQQQPMKQQPMQQQMEMTQMMPQQNVNVQNAQFETFAPTNFAPLDMQNIELIRDVPLQVTVELGRTKKSIAEILEFVPGTIVELDKIAGEPIDVLVNGKFVAKGEVVVIEENFGIRVTEIIK